MSSAAQVKVFRIKVMQELRLMVKGLVAGIRTLALAFVLLFVAGLCFGIVFNFRSLLYKGTYFIDNLQRVPYKGTCP